MKISLQNPGEIKPKSTEFKNRPAASPVSPKTTENVDRITISSRANKISGQFIADLREQILNQVKAGADPHMLDDLKRQVSLGEYDVNPADIVRRMMCD